MTKPTIGQSTWGQILNDHLDGLQAASDQKLAIIKKATAPTVALLGASITSETSQGAGSQDTVTSQVWFHAYGALSWAKYKLDSRIHLVKNAGVAGQRSDNIAARVTDITGLNPKPDWCIVADWATNDVLTDTNTSAQIIANGNTIVNALLAAGVRPVLCTILPTTGFNTTARKTTVSLVNEWVRSQASTSGVVVFDPVPVFVNPADGFPATNMSRDGTHMTDLGGQTVGMALAEAMRPHISGSPNLASSNVDTQNISLNPMMLGTAGTFSAGVTGSMADSWNAAWSGAAGVAAVSKVARTDGIAGEWQQITLSSLGELWTRQITLTSGWSVGETVQLEAEIQTDSNWSSVTKLMAYVSFVGSTNVAFDLYVTDATPPSLVSPGTGVLRTPRLVIPAGATNVIPVIIFKGAAGTIRIGRCRLKRVT